MPGNEDQELFEEAMAGVQKLEGRERTRPRSRALPKRAAGAERPRHESDDFTLERLGERVEGLRRGADPRLLTRLKGGEYPPEDRRDLHGMTRREAREAVEGLLSRARERRMRSVLVIHGRGKGSAGGPVLKHAVIERLSSPPWSKRVDAFASAPPRLGGAGATLVLLRA